MRARPSTSQQIERERERDLHIYIIRGTTQVYRRAWGTGKHSVGEMFLKKANGTFFYLNGREYNAGQVKPQVQSCMFASRGRHSCQHPLLAQAPRDSEQREKAAAAQ